MISPLGSGSTTPVFIGQTPAGQAVGLTVDAATQPLAEGGQPHQALARGSGNATVGLISSIDISKGIEFASDINQRNASLMNSTDGGPQGLQPVHSPFNGPAQIVNGIAIISGMRQR